MWLLLKEKIILDLCLDKNSKFPGSVKKITAFLGDFKPPGLSINVVSKLITITSCWAKHYA